jgi:xylan 1,4-beta-xylosidase
LTVTRSLLWVNALFLALAALAAGQDTVKIHVDAGKPLGPILPIWRYFGYDEPNYTYAKDGRKLIAELGKLGREPVYVRTHFLLCTGDGTPGLKWGSTNAYTEDAAGHPVYDWTIVDRVFDTYLTAGVKPFVEIGFMPQALSSKPAPYQPIWIPGARNENYSIGWTYPPKDYSKWEELVFEWVTHAVNKWGRKEVASWYWEVWNEPDISYWHGTAKEYDNLYDCAMRAVKHALPEARVGGPATTSPRYPKAAEYLRQFLRHCQGLPLDFITFHAKGSPRVVDGHLRMGLGEELKSVEQGIDVVRELPEYRAMPIVLSEVDPEGCAACSARVYPENAYRNGTLYPAYTAAAVNAILTIAERKKANIEGMLTWAFEFEDQPYFDGFRTLATNGIDKPILNLFRMLAMLVGDRLEASSNGAIDADAILASGVRDKADINVLAARGKREIAALIWNYHDDDVAAQDANIDLAIAGIPVAAHTVRVSHYRIDQKHSNAYEAWRAMGSPQKPTEAQYAQLEAAGKLAALGPAARRKPALGRVALSFRLPRQSVSMIQLSW